MAILIALTTLFAVSLANNLDGSIIMDRKEGEEGTMMDGREWLRSEQEMRWLYEEWIVEHDKSYSEERFETFKHNLRFIDEHNRPENNHTYTVGLNQFADLTDEEFRALYLSPPSINMSAGPSPPVTKRYRVNSGEKLPYSVDWRTVGAVSRVKNQGICRKQAVVVVVAAVS